VAAAKRVTRVERVLRQTGKDLAESGSLWALVGGWAVSARAEPRFTRDLDLALSVTSDQEAEAVCRHLLKRGYRLLATIEQEAAHRLATVRLSPPGEEGQGLIVDLLFASSGIEPEIVAEADPLEILPGVTAPVAQKWHLIALKVLADSPTRPQDQADLRALVRKSSPHEIEKARQALTLIRERGFHRNKDLTKDLETLLTSEGRGSVS